MGSPIKILVLCTGNSIRSQMAAGFLQSFDPTMEVDSAGTHPATRVHPYAIQVMGEIGIDISGGYPKHVDAFIRDSFDYVITVCDHANETCPVFLGRVGKRVHLGFRDPASVFGKPEDMLASFRMVRDEMKQKFLALYKMIKNGK